ncbi:MAG TPA: hypothetical protein VHL78_09870 [Actinomycetota bacterium]|nr:hypothetical protein [Actinomycetota bacterium]
MARHLISVAGLAMHLAVGYLYVTSGLVVPGVVLAVLVIAWAALLVVAIQRWRSPVFLLLVPIIAAALWAVVVLGFGSLLNWTA